MAMARFNVGTAYAAVPTFEGARKHMAVVIGRQGQAVQLAWINDLSTERVAATFFGREMMMVKRPDGEFTISAACPLDAVNAAEIMSMIKDDLKSSADSSELEAANVD